MAQSPRSGGARRVLSPEKLPLYLGFFALVYNGRQRGIALLGALIELLVTSAPGIHYEPSWQHPVEQRWEGLGQFPRRPRGRGHQRGLRRRRGGCGRGRSR
jgi:hypothetical protein